MVEKLAELIDNTTSNALATLASILVIVLYIMGGFYVHWTNDWLSFGGVVTGVPPFIMVFALQHTARKLQESQRRDTIAMQAKLDEMIRVMDNANNKLIGAEKLDPKEIAALASSVEEQAVIEPNHQLALEPTSDPTVKIERKKTQEDPPVS